MKNSLKLLPIFLTFFSMLLLFSCKEETTDNLPSVPEGMSAEVMGTSIRVSWDKVSNADNYLVFRSSNDSDYSFYQNTENVYLYDEAPLENNYYKVKAENSSGQSSYSSSVYCHYTSNNGGGGNGGDEPPTYLTAPTGLSSCEDGSNIKVTWNSVSSANSYRIYKSTASGTGYYNLGETYDSGTTYCDSYPDTYNYYKVQAVYYYEGDPTSYITSELSDYTYCEYSGGGGGGSSTISAPTGVSAEESGSGVYVSWNDVYEASYYFVYRSSSISGSYSKLESTYSTYYFDSAPNTENYYKITAVSYDGTESDKSSPAYCHYSSGGGGGSAPSAPTGVNADQSGSSVYVSWNSVSGATQYDVYRSSSGSNYSYETTTSNTYYYDNNPHEDNYYKIKATNSYGESSFSSPAYCHYTSGGGGGGNNYSPCPPNVSASGSSSQITVSWTISTGSGCGSPAKYEVYKQNPHTSSYEYCTETTSKTYKDNNVHPGVNSYCIKAINDNGSAIGYGSSTSIALPKPSSFTASKSGDQVHFTWSKVSMASGYQFFMSSSASGDYFVLDQVGDPNYTSHDSYFPASSGTYYFKMRAYWEYYPGGPCEYSDFTPYKSVTF